MSQPGYVGPAANPAAQDKQRKRDKQRQDLFAAQMRWVMEGPSGRAVLAWLIWERCLFGQYRYEDNNKHEQYVKGAQGVGQSVHDMLERDFPELLDRMRCEYRASAQLTEQLNSSATAEATKEKDDA